MSNARFWFVPLKHVAPAERHAEIAAQDDVRASDLPPSYVVPSKLFQEGIRVGHVLALHDGDKVVALARMLALDSADTLLWRRLPMLEAPELSATPELREITPAEAQQFKIGIDAILRDMPTSTVATAVPTAPAKTCTPTHLASNVLLYGPPGTGKTHSVRRRALELLGDANAARSTLPEVNADWDRLRRDGQIVFCTFHQAFAYEEFVEGLRAITDEAGSVHYRVEAGVFKRLALTAAAEGLAVDDESHGDFDDLWETLVEALRAEPRIVESSKKMKYQLEAAPRGGVLMRGGMVDDEEVFEPNGKWLIATQNSMRALWKRKAQLGESPKTADMRPLAEGHLTAMWIVYRELIQRQKSNHRSADPVARAHRAFASGRNFAFGAGCRQFVIVIDEINRANIARVFGELITLLEPDKRLGSSNELRVQLPASKEWFGVPPNLHVLGTMNTADRSIALMDVALRRRFTFEEMMPSVEVLAQVLEENKVDQELRKLVLAVFKRLNERLRFLYDREHQIGHAYFLGIGSIEALRTVFADRILPLLQEYFFGQWGKLAITLGYPLTRDGTPRETRDEKWPAGTFLTATKMEERVVIGFDHDDYEQIWDWNIHPEFRSQVKHNRGETWLRQAFNELLREGD